MPNRIKFRCPKCSKVLGAPVEKAGKKAKCPACATVFVIPLPKTEAAVAASIQTEANPSVEQKNDFRFMDGFTHGPKFVGASEGYGLDADDSSRVASEKAKLLRANIEINRRERAVYWAPKLSSRFFGFIIDYLIISLPIALVGFLGSRAVLSDLMSSGGASWAEIADATRSLGGLIVGLDLAFAFLWIVYQGVLVALKGSTLGKMATKTMVVDRDFASARWGRAFARGAAYMLSFWTFPIGFLVGLFTVGKRPLHDLVAGTYVTRRPD